MQKKFENFIDVKELARIKREAENAKKLKNSFPKRDRIPYDEPLPMVVDNITPTKDGCKVDVSIYSNDKRIKRQFSFCDKYPSYLDSYVDNINPDADSLADIVGVPYWGRVTRTGAFENVQALSLEEVEELEDTDEYEDDYMDSEEE